MHCFIVFADYYQVYIWDHSVLKARAHINPWTETAYLNERVAVSEALVGISTVRNLDVPVEVDIRDSEPEERLQDWDQVVDCSIEIRSGRISVSGPDFERDSPEIQITPGAYRARVFFGGLNTLSSDEVDGEDRYRVVFWPGPPTPVTVLKAGTTKAR
jgi:hypothetical protein